MSLKAATTTKRPRQGRSPAPPAAPAQEPTPFRFRHETERCHRCDAEAVALIVTRCGRYETDYSTCKSCAPQVALKALEWLPFEGWPADLLVQLATIREALP